MKPGEYWDSRDADVGGKMIDKSPVSCHGGGLLAYMQNSGGVKYGKFSLMVLCPSAFPRWFSTQKVIGRIRDLHQKTLVTGMLTLDFMAKTVIAMTLAHELSHSDVFLGQNLVTGTYVLRFKDLAATG